MISILVVLFIFSTIPAFFPPKNPKISFWLYLVLGAILIATAGFRGEDSTDYFNYVTFFNQRNLALVEPSFLLISYFINTFLHANVIYLFISFAFLGVSLKFVAIKNLTPLLYLSVLIYISNFFILHEMIQIRAGVASAFLLLCIKPIFDRNWKVFLVYAALGISFHYSALVILPLWFLGKEPRKIWMLLSIPIGYLIYFLGINLIVGIPIPGIQEKIGTYQKLQEMGDEEMMAINVFNFVFLAKILMFYFLLYKYDLLLLKNKFTPILMKIYCISLVVYPALATIPAIATRTSELYGIVSIILIPMMFYIFKPILFSRAIVISIGIAFLSMILFYAKII